MKSTDKIQQKTVVTQVMERIKSLIATGQYKVNERIPTETELAEMFGVGRSSVREAVKTFQHLGVLESRVPKGTFVCDRSKISQEAITWSILLGQDRLDEILHLRYIIEKDGVEALVGGLSRKTEEAAKIEEKLRSVIRDMAEGSRAKSTDMIALADFSFHAAIIEASQNELFRSIYETLQAFVQEEIRRTYLVIPDLDEIVSDHLEILDAILSLDLPHALSRHSEHFIRIRELLREAANPPVA